jgi:hypothetical protein
VSLINGTLILTKHCKLFNFIIILYSRIIYYNEYRYDNFYIYLFKFKGNGIYYILIPIPKCVLSPLRITIEMLQPKNSELPQHRFLNYSIIGGQCYYLGGKLPSFFT